MSHRVRPHTKATQEIEKKSLRIGFFSEQAFPEALRVHAHVNFELMRDRTEIVCSHFTEDLPALRAMTSQHLVIEDRVGDQVTFRHGGIIGEDAIRSLFACQDCQGARLLTERAKDCGELA